MADDYVKPEDEPEGHVTSEDLVPGDDVPEAPEDLHDSGEESEDVDERLASDDDEDNDDDDSDNQLDLGDTPDE